MNILIANRLTELRKNNNYSQEELAKMLGVSRQSVSKWERAEASPDTDNLIELSKIYGISLDELINLDNNMIKEHNSRKNNSLKFKIPGLLEIEKNSNDASSTCSKRLELINAIVLPISSIICLVSYIICGFLLRGTSYSWSSMWVLMLIPIVIESIFDCIKERKASKFNISVLVVIVYCFIGLSNGLWHPYWVLFLLIPTYYGIVGPIESLIHKENDDK